MLQEITIKNFKSIADDTISLGRVNVFIGENGCGKSNILEALAFASTSLISPSIDKDILAGKGVRIAKPSLMVNSFKGKKQNPEILIEIKKEQTPLIIRTMPDNDDIHSAKWLGEKVSFPLIEEKVSKVQSTRKILQKELSLISNASNQDGISELKKEFKEFMKKFKEWEESREETENEFNLIKLFEELQTFSIYCLNTPALRGLTQQSHKEPVGIYGENLDVLIANFSKAEKEKLKAYNYFIGWLDDYILDMNDRLKLHGYKQNLSKSRLYFSDKYMRKDNNVFSSENANEGILHLLFYLAVMISKDTPKIFAIDNIESCLNPHLCRFLMKEICKLAKEEDKQVLITTHNPAILDGLNLFDDEIRLFVVSRNNAGQTKTKRIELKPEHEQKEGRKLKLSELWTRGYLGAISQDF